MAIPIISLIVIVCIASQMDKWQTTRHIKGKYTADDIKELFGHSGGKR